MTNAVHVVLVAHGSRREGAEAPLHALAAALIARGVAGRVDVVTRPFSARASLPALPSNLDVVVVPLFIALADDELDRLRAQWSQPRVVVSAPVGSHPRFVDVVVARADEVDPAAAILVVGHGSSRSASACPLPALVATINARGRRAALGYLEVQSPSIGESLSTLNGDVVIVPAFFLRGQHTVVDIPQIVDDVRPTARLAEPLLDHERLVDIVADLVHTTVTTLTVAARTTTRSDHISPL